MTDLTHEILEHLPVSMQAGLTLLPKRQPIVLFTRHSIRVLVDEQGFAGYKLPLTEQGRQLASAWGAHLKLLAGREFRACLSSPIHRCVDTALLMLEGRHENKLANDIQPEVVKTTLLVEPGSFVQDDESLRSLFFQYGALEFINHFLGKKIAGMKHPVQGALDILGLLYQHLPEQEDSVLLAVSHDTILAVFLAVLHDEVIVSAEDWPEMMEGAYLWFEDNGFTGKFEESTVHWVWRGVAHSRLISSFVE
ncbi:MAG: phosphoglycerate mutase family protein [Candidatus Saccharibacteria bacterium]|nr:phosphoglycerate mutase family protein [Moraxellaceae bacterium]